jgi:GNAT superfamily N-acetyltransferase
MRQMNLTLAEVFAHPEIFTHTIELPTVGRVRFRPLEAGDVDELGAFLSGLSPTTTSYDRTGAQLLCDAINRYDKLRFVVELPAAGQISGQLSGQIIALYEFSFDIPDYDLERFARYGVPLDQRTDCRYGPTIADEYQNRGVGSQTFPYLVAVAKRFGKDRIILWGGVFVDNARAIHFYEKQGFRPLGTFEGYEGGLVNDMILDLPE